MLRIPLKRMAMQALSALALITLLLSTQAKAADDVSQTCFDFSKKVTRPLKEAISWTGAAPSAADGQREDISDRGKVSGAETGKPENGYVWARARGIVHKPIRTIFEMLLDHNTTKSGKIKELEVKKMQDPNYLARHIVEFRVNAVLFFTVSWVEDWVYALAKGTPENPEQIVISYQKTEGTSHIEHLCGNIVLTKIGPDTTDVYTYEEVKATQRTDEDTENGLRGTLMTLRKTE